MICLYCATRRLRRGRPPTFSIAPPAAASAPISMGEDCPITVAALPTLAALKPGGGARGHHDSVTGDITILVDNGDAPGRRPTRAWHEEGRALPRDLAFSDVTTARHTRDAAVGEFTAAPGTAGGAGGAAGNS
jgi:hypothetical protein